MEDQRTTFTLDLYWERGTRGGERKGGEMKKSGVLTAHGSVLSRTGNAFTEFCLPGESLLAVGWRYASQNEVTIEAFS